MKVMDRPALWHINLNLNIYSIFYILFILFRESGSSEILRPRGVSISSKQIYLALISSSVADVISYPNIACGI